MDAFSWGWLLAACAAAFLIKLSGYCVPASWLASPRIQHMANAATVGLLSALVVLNTLGDGRALIVDARLAALLVAMVALWLRLPFLLVVLLGAASAALVRLWI